jgi:hypothetical protein
MLGWQHCLELVVVILSNQACCNALLRCSDYAGQRRALQERTAQRLMSAQQHTSCRKRVCAGKSKAMRV